MADVCRLADRGAWCSRASGYNEVIATINEQSMLALIFLEPNRSMGVASQWRDDEYELIRADLRLAVHELQHHIHSANKLMLPVVSFDRDTGLMQQQTPSDDDLGKGRAARAKLKLLYDVRAAVGLGKIDEFEANLKLAQQRGFTIENLIVDNMGTNLLVLAQVAKQEAMFDHLLASSVASLAIDAIDRRTGDTPLTYAASKTNYKGLLALLHKGADVNAADATGRSPLTVVFKGNQDKTIAKVLLERGAKVGAVDPEFVAAARSSTLAVAEAVPKPEDKSTARDLLDITPEQLVNAANAKTIGQKQVLELDAATRSHKARFQGRLERIKAAVDNIAFESLPKDRMPDLANA
jgi:hypothetical protein